MQKGDNSHIHDFRFFAFSSRTFYASYPENTEKTIGALFCAESNSKEMKFCRKRIVLVRPFLSLYTTVFYRFPSDKLLYSKVKLDSLANQILCLGLGIAVVQMYSFNWKTVKASAARRKTLKKQKGKYIWGRTKQTLKH